MQTLDILIGEQQAKQQAELTLLQEQQAKPARRREPVAKETELAEQIRRREKRSGSSIGSKIRRFTKAVVLGPDQRV